MVNKVTKKIIRGYIAMLDELQKAARDDNDVEQVLAVGKLIKEAQRELEAVGGGYD